MASQGSIQNKVAPLTIPGWVKQLPLLMMGGGGLLALVGAFVDTKQFGYSYLVAFMVFLSLSLGSLFLLMMHHLFDANWSVPIRRFVEHLACLFPVLAILFLPIAILAKTIYPWMTLDPALDHSLHVKKVLFNQVSFYVVAAALFGIWTFYARGFRKASLEQDKTGAASCTQTMRRYAASGVFVFALSLTLAVIFWMKSLEHQWFSTMYGVYYFASSVWLALATTYVIALVLKRTGPLEHVVGNRQFHDIGVLFLTFTVFYAYITFSQYFLIWNAAIPEETFWYVKRERGSWWGIGMLILFGHFVVPFLLLLRIDFKLNAAVMIPLCVWAWMMHFCDMSFNIMPVLHPEGFKLNWIDVACMAFFAGVLSKVFLKDLNSHPVYPQRDPRIAETMGVYVEPAGSHSK